MEQDKQEQFNRINEWLHSLASSNSEDFSFAEVQVSLSSKRTDTFQNSLLNAPLGQLLAILYDEQTKDLERAYVVSVLGQRTERKARTAILELLRQREQDSSVLIAALHAVSNWGSEIPAAEIQ